MKRAKRRKFRMRLFDIADKMVVTVERYHVQMVEVVGRTNALLQRLMGSKK